MGNITTWTQQQDTNAAKAYDFEYDRADQLRTGVWRTTDETPTVLKRYGYGYDPAGNRTVEQMDNAPVLSAYDDINRIASQTPGGTMRFAGTLNEAATVTIEGLPADVTSDNEFAGGAPVNSGTNSVVVKARDYSGNERTNTYEVSVSGSSTTFTFDANGNMLGDGTRTFEWDAENRLKATVLGTTRTEFTYDALGRRSRILEKDNEVVTEDRRLLWCRFDVCEERDESGDPVARFFAEGVSKNAASFFFTFDHLGSVREVTDSTASIRARYEYGPFGGSTKVAGDLESDFGLGGMLRHLNSGFLFSISRVYDSKLGRWMARDPLLEYGAVDTLPRRDKNPYAYTANNPVRFTDPSGLQTGAEVIIICSPDPISKTVLAALILLGLIVIVVDCVNSGLCSVSEDWTKRRRFDVNCDEEYKLCWARHPIRQCLWCLWECEGNGYWPDYKCP